MSDWSAMPSLLQAFWIIALLTSLIFTGLTIMTFAGGDGHDGASADFDGDLESSHTFQVLTFRNLVTFGLGFGWAGVLFWSRIHEPFWLILISLGTGLVFVAAFFLVLFQVSRLSEDQTFQIEHAIGKSATVYLKIPAAGQGHGKILVAVAGVTRELDAVSKGTGIATGIHVRVAGVVAPNTVTVE